MQPTEATWNAGAPWDLMVRAVQANITAGQEWVLLYVRRWLAAPLQMPDGTRAVTGGRSRRLPPRDLAGEEKPF